MTYKYIHTRISHELYIPHTEQAVLFEQSGMASWSPCQGDMKGHVDTAASNEHFDAVYCHLKCIQSIERLGRTPSLPYPSFSVSSLKYYSGEVDSGAFSANL